VEVEGPPGSLGRRGGETSLLERPGFDKLLDLAEVDRGKVASVRSGRGRRSSSLMADIERERFSICPRPPRTFGTLNSCLSILYRHFRRVRD
jgi:hypothetical protein